MATLFQFRYHFEVYQRFIIYAKTKKPFNDNNQSVVKMSDLLDEDLEFRGGTLQLSTEGVETAERHDAADGKTPQRNANPSVLSGADSLTSSSSSFAGG